MNPVSELQTRLIAAIDADATLQGLLAGAPITDAPAKGASKLSVTIAEHDLAKLYADVMSGFEHRLTFAINVPGIDRAKAALIDANLRTLVESTDLDSSELAVTHRHHVRTQSGFDAKSGMTRARTRFVFFTQQIS